MSERTVMLAAGGTGGHLFPAFALAEELQRRSITVDLVTDTRGDRYGTGFPARAVHQVPAATLGERSAVAAARTAMTLARGVKAAHALLGEVKPSLVLGFGGYPTFPPLIAAKLQRIATAIHEQNAVLGRANRMLAARVDAIATSFEETALIPARAMGKVRLTGNPVRAAVIDWGMRQYRAAGAGDPFRLLVFGGSQGARFLSETVPAAVALLAPHERARLRIVQQCREEDLPAVQAAYSRDGVMAELAPFFKDLPERMAAAHLVIGRAGASTIAELTVMGRPSLLVPLPHAVDNDQLRNARALAACGAAWCFEQKALTPPALAEALSGFMAAPDALKAAADAAKRQGRPDAVIRLADLVEELIGLRAKPKATSH